MAKSPPPSRPAVPVTKHTVDTVRWVRILAAVGILLLSAGLATQIVASVAAPFSVPGDSFVDPDGEANVWAWYSSALLLALALALGVVGLVRAAAGEKLLPYAVIAGVALYLAVDEAASLHENIGRAAPKLDAAPWLTIAIPLAVAASIGILIVARRIDPVLRRRLIVAGALFLVGAVGVEAVEWTVVRVTGLPGIDQDTVVYALASALEEGLEMAGTLVALWAAVAGLALRVGPKGLRLKVAAPSEGAAQGGLFGRAADNPSAVRRIA